MSVHAESPIAVRIVDVARPLGPIQDVARTIYYLTGAGVVMLEAPPPVEPAPAQALQGAPAAADGDVFAADRDLPVGDARNVEEVVDKARDLARLPLEDAGQARSLRRRVRDRPQHMGCGVDSR